MIKKFFICVAASFLSLSVFAHDEGHGPKVKNQGKYGGKMTSVILKKDHDAADAKAHYIAELTLSNDGMLRVYFYDTNLQPTVIAPKALTGTLIIKNKNAKNSSKTNLVFNPKGNSFEAKIDPVANRSAGLELVISTAEQDYLADFVRIK